MPELPEVETTKASLAPLLDQKMTKVEVFQPQLRWSMPPDLTLLKGYYLQSVDRRAKYLILTFVPSSSTQSDSNVLTDNTEQSATKKLLIHLGMSGSLQQHPHGMAKRKHDHLILTFSDINTLSTQLHYHDPRRFGSILWYEDYATKLLEHLGVEPLSNDFTADYLYQLIQRTSASNPIENSAKKQQSIKKAIKSVIMDQQVVVGVGNIYAAESLYLSGIHPATPADQISYEQVSLLVAHIKSILIKAIQLGGSTLRDFTVASGQTGYFQQTLNVYGRQGELCIRCKNVLENIKLNGRASIYCAKCQPLK